MIRTLLRQSVLGGVVSSVLVFAAGASAGTPFRLEIGPPIAGATKVKGAAFAVRALACDDPSTVKMTERPRASSTALGSPWRSSSSRSTHPESLRSLRTGRAAYGW